MGKSGGMQLFDDKRDGFFSICDLASQWNFQGENVHYQYQTGGLFASVGQMGMNFGVSPNSPDNNDNGNVKSPLNDMYVKYVASPESARIVELPEGEQTVKKKKGALKLKIKISNPSLRRLFSGAVAGAVSRTAVAPLETIRTHLMVGSSGHSTTEVFNNIMKTDGWKGLFRGNFVNVIRVAPSKAIEVNESA